MSRDATWGGYDQSPEEKYVETRPTVIHELGQPAGDAAKRNAELGALAEDLPYDYIPAKRRRAQYAVRKHSTKLWHNERTEVDEETPAITFYGYWEIWNAYHWVLRSTDPQD